MNNFQKGFDALVFPFQDNFRSITISEKKLGRIKSLVKRIIDAKKNESHHLKDPFQEEKRWMTGLSGEAACEELLGLNIIDWEIGPSAKFHESDLGKKGYSVGIKTVEWGKFHVIFKISRYPQILVFKISDQEFKVCGLAPPEILNSHQDINLILSPMLRQRGSKTAFIGYRELDPVVSISDISKHRANSGSTSDPTCPTCGSELVKRNGKFGIFWGCKSFPKCRFTRNQNVP